MTAAGRAGQRGLSIGAVLARLRPEFPDVTISKIRFWETEGLVRPARGPSGYRQFSPSDLERLRYILTAQRDQYLPLRVIRERLDAADRAETGHDPAPAVDARVGSGEKLGGRSTAPAGEDGRESFPTNDGLVDHRVRFTREGLLSAAGIEEATLAELEAGGLVTAADPGCYDEESVRVAATARSLARFGLGSQHLRTFRAAADREAGLLARAIRPRGGQRNAEGSVPEEQAPRELAALAGTLHTLLVNKSLREATGG